MNNTQPTATLKFVANVQDINDVIAALDKKIDALKSKAGTISFGAAGGSSAPASGSGPSAGGTGSSSASSAAGVVNGSTANPALSPPILGSGYPGNPPPASAPPVVNPALGAAGVVNAANASGNASGWPGGVRPPWAQVSGSGGYGPSPSGSPPAASAPVWPGGNLPLWASAPNYAPLPPNAGSGGNPSGPGPNNPNNPPNRPQPPRPNYAVARIAGMFAGGLNQYAQSVASGEPDPMAMAQLHGGLAGAAVGGAMGTLVNQTFTGEMAGQQIGSAAAALAIAPFLRTRSAALTLASYAARSRFNPLDEILPGRSAGASLEELSEDVSFRGKSLADKLKIKMGTYTGVDVISVPKLAQTAATLGSAALEAGEDPRSLVTETAGRLARKYGLATPDIARLAAPVLADVNRAGRNATDLLLTHGVESYGAYTDVEGRADLTPKQRSTVAALQVNENRLTRAGLQARGVGAAQENLYQKRLDDLTDLPDGSSSVAYAEARANKRSATLQKYAEQDTVNFDIPQMALSGRMARRRYMPYEPGGMMKDAVEDAGLKSREFRTKSARYASLVASGQVSESQQAGMFGELEDLKTGIAQDVGTLNTNVENRMMGMSVGRPSYRGHWDSLSLVRFSLFQSGAPNQSAGAINGKHLQHQRDWWASVSSPDFDAASTFAPHSRTQGVNNAGLESIMGRVLGVLERMEREGRKVGNPASSLFPGERRGNQAAIQATATFDMRKNY